MGLDLGPHRALEVAMELDLRERAEIETHHLLAQRHSVRRLPSENVRVGDGAGAHVPGVVRSGPVALLWVWDAERSALRDPGSVGDGRILGRAHEGARELSASVLHPDTVLGALDADAQSRHASTIVEDAVEVGPELKGQVL